MEMMELTPVKKRVDDIQVAIETGRENYIGGSDAGTILGFNRYKSKYTLWAEKCGFVKRSAPDPRNERIRLGHDLEQYVAERWMEATGKKCRRDNVEYSLAEYPYMVGHIDRRVIGEEAGLEIKTTSEFNKTDFAAGEIQDEWYIQCQHYMAVTGLKRWYLAVLQFGKGVYFFRINRDDADIEGLVKAESAFYEMVQSKTAPIIDGSDSTSETISAMWDGKELDECKDLTSLADIITKRDVIEAQIKSLEQEKTKIDNNIKAALGEATGGICGSWNVAYRVSERVTLDSKKLKTEMPDIYERFSRKTKSRALKITIRKEEKQ